MTQEIPDMSAWPLADAEKLLSGRGLFYTVKETKAPYEDKITGSREFYVVRTELKDNGFRELLVCGKIRKGGAKYGL